MQFLLRFIILLTGFSLLLVSGILAVTRRGHAGITLLTLSSEAFLSDPQIFRLSPDGRNRMILAEGYNPTWSPDGHWIAFEYSGVIYRITPYGRHQERLAPRDPADRACYNPHWSPDGRWIAYGQIDGLYVMRPDGSRPTLIVDGLASGFWRLLFWSHDSQWIYILIGSSEGYSIDRYQVDGSAHEVLFQGDGRTPNEFLAANGADLSPDGEWIVYTVYDLAFHPSGLLRMRLDGSERQTILTLEQMIPGYYVSFLGGPAWSPDGTYISFYAGVYHGGQIYLVRPDGSDFHPLSGFGAGGSDWVEIKRPFDASWMLGIGAGCCLVGVIPLPYARRRSRRNRSQNVND